MVPLSFTMSMAIRLAISQGMAQRESSGGPNWTPFFQDKHGRTLCKSAAARVHVRRYDAHGKSRMFEVFESEKKDPSQQSLLARLCRDAVPIVWRRRSRSGGNEVAIRLP